MSQDGFLPLGRRLLETVDIVPQKGGVHADGTGEFGDIDLLMGQEELLHRRRLGIFIDETLETDILVDITPMDAVEAEGIFLPLLLTGSPKPGIPEKRLAVDAPVIGTAKNLVVAEPYFFDLDHILFPNIAKIGIIFNTHK